MLGIPVNVYGFNPPRERLRFPHLTLDTTHLATWGLNPAEFYRGLKERVVHVHLSNFDGREHRLPPDGHLNLDRLLRLLADDHYPGTVSVESEPDALDSWDPLRCRAALMRALAFCREHLPRVSAGHWKMSSEEVSSCGR